MPLRKDMKGFGMPVVEEVVYVPNMDTAFAAAGPVRKEAYGAKAQSGKYDCRNASIGAANTTD